MRVYTVLMSRAPAHDLSMHPGWTLIENDYGSRWLNDSGAKVCYSFQGTYIYDDRDGYTVEFDDLPSALDAAEKGMTRDEVEALRQVEPAGP
jgi:hypothetical protein